MGARRRDEFDRLSEMVNRMLDEIERPVEEVRGAGDAIAHDLRTPLTRLRARLDRALDSEARHAPVEEVLGKSVADVDQLLATVTAVLRLAELEEGRARAVSARTTWPRSWTRSASFTARWRRKRASR